MNGPRAILILLGLVGLASANVITVDPVDKILNVLKAYFSSLEDETMMRQVESLLKISRSSCDSNLVNNILGMVDSKRFMNGSSGPWVKIQDDIKQFRKDMFTSCSSKFAEDLMEQVSHLSKKESESINKFRSMVEIENQGESLLPVIPEEPMIEGAFKFIVKEGNLQDLKSKSSYSDKFKEIFNDSVTEVCESIVKLSSVKVYDNFIYDRFIYGPNSSLLGQIDPQAKDWITNYHICSRLLTDNLLRPKVFVDFAKTKFTGRKWF